MGTYTHAHTHSHARNLPSTDAIGPEIDEGEFNRRPLQATFLILQGGARPATFLAAIFL